MPGPGSKAVPKPVHRKAARRRKTSRERAVAQTVRDKVVERDGHCRLGRAIYRYRPAAALAAFGECEGPTEWAHLGDSKRFKTRGMEPEERHTTAGSMAMCRNHHQGDKYGYDRHKFDVEPTTERGADGPCVFVSRRAPCAVADKFVD